MEDVSVPNAESERTMDSEPLPSMKRNWVSLSNWKFSISFKPYKNLFVLEACLYWLMGILSVTQLVIGIKYRHDCPIQPNLPKSLIVFGVFLLCKVILYIFIIKKKAMLSIPVRYMQSIDWTLIHFLMAWTIVGFVWTIGATMPEFDNEMSSQYCKDEVYMLALVSNTAFLAFMAAMLSFGVMLLTFCAIFRHDSLILWWAGMVNSYKEATEEFGFS